MQTLEALIKAAVHEAVIEALAEYRPAPPVQAGVPTASVKATAAKWGLPPNKLYDMTHRQDCDFCVVVGRRRIILQQKFKEFMERQAKQGEAQRLA